MVLYACYDKKTILDAALPQYHAHANQKITRMTLRKYAIMIEQESTISIKPMRSTGMTGQSSRRGMCVIPNIYLKLTRVITM